MATSSSATKLDEGRTTTRGWKVNRKGKVSLHRDRRVNVRDPALISDTTRGQRLIPIPPCHAVMKYMIPSVLVLVTLKYQGKTESVFEENPAPVWCLLVGSVLYWLIVGQMKRMETPDGGCFHILNRAALASVVLSAASLASMFLPRRITFTPLMVLTPLPVLPLVQLVLYRAYTRVRSRIASFIQRIRLKLAPSETSLPV